jgi:peptide/nickel transport system permease protein
MLGLLIRRAASGLLVLFVLVTAIFFFSRMVSDPVLMMVPEEATPEQIEAVRARLGLDRPVGIQYLDYMTDLLRGDMGTSYRWGLPVWTLLVERMPATLQLSFLSVGIAIVVALPIGILGAIRPGSWIDAGGRFVAVVGQSMPVFWLGILLIILFAVNLRVLPAGGAGTWAHLVLPSVALSTYSIPITMRIVRSGMLETLSLDYVRTARAKGLPERTVVIKHALRNALIPVVTVLALRLGHIIAGAVVLEQVFAYPGMGRLAVQGMLQGDFFVLQGFIVLVAAMVITLNFLADVIYGLLDPRIRVS